MKKSILATSISLVMSHRDEMPELYTRNFSKQPNRKFPKRKVNKKTRRNQK